MIQNCVKVKKLITVAGFNLIKFEEDNSLYDSFYIKNEELVKLENYCEERICLYSDDDSFVPMQEAENFAEYIKADKILIKNAGHFNEKSGYKEFKEILQYL